MIGDKFNILVDDLWMVLMRLYQLPLAFQVILWLFMASLFWLLTFKLLGIFKKSWLTPSVKIYIYSSTTLLFLIVGAVTINDFQLHNLELKASLNTKETIIVFNDSTSNHNNFYLQKYFQSLKRCSFGKEIAVNYLQADDGLEIIKLTMVNPQVSAFIATVDLTKYEIGLDTSIAVKTRTAKIAKRNDWDIAVNGEAGTAASRDAPLGSWIGNFIVDGQLVLLEDSRYRPFIYFDKNNHVYFSREEEVVKKPTELMHNVIWGRFNMIINGANAISKHDYTSEKPYPRTLVGMNKEGNRMFLMVVDGRKPLYSIGFNMEQVVELFRIIGVENAMACDQGGSSLMYSKKLNVINRPCDGGERAVYTHLGFKKKSN